MSFSIITKNLLADSRRFLRLHLTDWRICELLSNSTAWELTDFVGKSVFMLEIFLKNNINIFILFKPYIEDSRPKSILNRCLNSLNLNKSTPNVFLSNLAKIQKIIQELGWSPYISIISHFLVSVLKMTLRISRIIFEGALLSLIGIKWLKFLDELRKL